MDDIIEFSIPMWAVCPLINADRSALEDEDEQALDAFIDRTVEQHGNANFMLPADDQLEPDFRHRNDVDRYANDCITLLLRPSK